MAALRDGVAEVRLAESLAASFLDHVALPI